MKYLRKYKLFENYENFDLKQFSCWLIYGNKFEILKIVEKIGWLVDEVFVPGGNYEKSIDFTKLKFRLISVDLAYQGIILYFGKGFSYSLLSSEKEKERLLNTIRSHPETYKFEGEVKLIDDKLVLDTLEVDMNKYNL